ncbi:MAG: hypothetical protein ABIQ90_02090 [Polaromonas sp.]
MTAAQQRRIKLAALISGKSLSQFCRYAIRDLDDMVLNYTLECERKDDGRFLADVPELPGVIAYGGTENEAKAKAEELARREIAEDTHWSDSLMESKISRAAVWMEQNPPQTTDLSELELEIGQRTVD